ncbi:hypothetical protein QUA41_16435 [Microcoleus sp. Pol11C1]|uniref:hypothetical protein n=1 Tax=unclassified Microcoleus TaxID=2642155 RepID=UPI002FD0F5E2
MTTSLAQNTGLEKIAYEEALSEAIEVTFAEWETSEAMTAEEACKRSRVISDQTLE